MPEVASLPLQVTPTVWLYQPLWSGVRPAAAETPVGGSASILITFVVALTVPLAFDAEHDRVVPVFGPSTLIAIAQSVLSAPVTDQWTTTKLPPELPLYQSFVPASPSMVYEIDGSESAGLGLAAGASQSNATNANAGIRSRPTRRSHDVSLETTIHPDVCYGGLKAPER
jgi:hypothetical protein